MKRPCIYRHPKTLTAEDLAGEIRVLEKLECDMGSGFKRYRAEFYRLRALRMEWKRRRMDRL